MKRFVSMLGLGLLTVLVVIQPLFAQYPPGACPDGCEPGGQGGAVPFSTQLPSMIPGRMWFEVNLADNGLGYEGAYGTLGAKTRLFQDYFDGRWLAEMQGHVSLDNGGFFGNLGIERVFSIESAPADVAFGVFYDRDDASPSNFSHSLDQIGISAAVRARKFDVRANGYLPVGTSDYTAGGLNGEKGFIGNNFALKSGIDAGLKGFDTELRLRPYWLTMINGTVDVGGYYYTADSVDAFGGVRGRLGFQAFRGGLVSLEVNHDDRFETTAVLQLAWQYGGRGGVSGHEYSIIGRDLEPTVRQDHITRYNQETQLAINPATGRPYNFLHVDNSTGTGGTGSVDNRFQTLAQAETRSGTNDVIFVYEGNGTSTGYDAGITLQNGQYLLGDGVEHRLPLPGGRSTLLCNDTDGLRPTLVNDGGDIVTLANNNTVAGLVLDGLDPANNGIVGTNVSGPTTIRDNNIINMLVDGININGLTGDVLIRNNRFDNIGDDAIDISNYSGTGRTFTVDTNRIVQADDNGIILSTFSSENTFAFTNNVITDVGSVAGTTRTGDGIALVNGVDAIAGTGGTYQISDNRILRSARNGLTIKDVLDPEAVFTIEDNTMTDSGEDAILVDNSVGTFALTGGTFAGTAGSGFHYEANNGGVARIALADFNVSGANIGALFNVSNGTTLNASLVRSSIDNSVTHGVQMNALDAGSAINLQQFRDNVVTNSGGRGLELNGVDDTVITGTVIQNLFQNNAQGGLVAETVGGELDLIVGGVPGPAGAKPANPQNVFDGNGGVGVGLLYRGDATGRFNIDENIFINQVNDPASSIFNGDAVHVRLAGVDALDNSTAVLRDDAVLGPSTISNNVIGSLTDTNVGNVNNGIQIHSEDETVIEALNILNNEIGNNGNDGLNVVARDSSMVNNLLVADNVIDSNGGQGVDVTSSESARLVAVTPAGIRNNQITNNTLSGVLMQVTADAQMIMDIQDNTIDNNGADGIATTEVFGSAADLRSLEGNWSRNSLSNNASNGINLVAGSDMVVVDSNIIDSNGLYGITLPGPISGIFSNNQITRNGTTAPARGLSGGVNIFGAGTKELEFIDNLIFDNTGDGMRIVNSGETFTINVEGNTIESNSFRGMSVLNQGGGSELDLTIRNNKIASNELEGLFVINTSSNTQNIDQDIDPAGGGPLNADGANNAVTIMNLIVDGNRIINNGSASPNTVTGMVLLVGTNDGGYEFTEDGEFFAEGRGGVGAQITDNVFSGNLGEDFFVRSFVSTVPPAVTGGQWTDQNTNPRVPGDDVFNPINYQGDALARLDLLWRGNIFDSVSLNNVGASHNNDEAIFKSRTVQGGGGPDNDTDGGIDDDGPFDSGTRSRNAQRLAARNVGPGGVQLNPDLTIGASDSFLFAGMGQSTFRLLDTSDILDGFILDDFYIDFNDANGAGNSAPPNDMPFGWNLETIGGNPRPQ